MGRDPGNDRCDNGHSWPREDCRACEAESKATDLWAAKGEIALLQRANTRLKNENAKLKSELERLRSAGSETVCDVCDGMGGWVAINGPGVMDCAQCDGTGKVGK